MKKYSIKDFYMPAVTEGEGAGTAYEYFLKRKILDNFTDAKRIIIFGLPEKYGYSMDFIMFGKDIGADIIVVDERQEKLDSLKPIINNLNLNNIEINNFNAVNVEDECDLLLSSEVLQRMEDKEDYIKRGKAISKQQVIFAPNAGNDSHNKLSGLQSVSLEEMTKLTQGKAGYLDFPPFPPGIKRSEEQKEKAKSGMFENFAMKGLEGWAWSEKFYPDFIKEKFAHIVYGIS